MSKVWKYAEQPPQFANPGKFVAWICGSGSRSYPSAAAVRVEKIDGSEASFEAIMPSEAGSTSPRAHLGATIGALEAIPPHSSLEIRAFDENTVIAINSDIASWQANGWRKSDGSEPANLDALKRINEIIHRRSLAVSATLVTDRKSQGGLIIEGLKKKASEERKKRSVSRAA